MKPILLFSLLLLSCHKQTPNDLLQKAFEAEKNLQYKQAIGYFNTAIALDSSYADSYYHRGICYAYLIKPNKAIEDYSKAIKLQPNFLAAYQERASIYYAIGKYDLGIKDINFALQLAPRNKTSLNIRLLLVQEIRGTH
ncbi:tetratricopeptide repeat protein [Flavobacterium aciduliphilum]|uniref:Tetratricopeptide repeat protein n=1 Tax=Flavobacterium aciduliphilum TaxID=1101402 RepID=A0A328YIB9_9FLAO|nr:tetratricopeptide repeat protein [Flavobacterium aciduliphilum]RAR73791.1 tetratricopeptide repeat protein [Flavobacterium aciduliphilum]